MARDLFGATFSWGWIFTNESVKTSWIFLHFCPRCIWAVEVSFQGPCNCSEYHKVTVALWVTSRMEHTRRQTLDCSSSSSEIDSMLGSTQSLSPQGWHPYLGCSRQSLQKYTWEPTLHLMLMRQAGWREQCWVSSFRVYDSRKHDSSYGSSQREL